MDRGPPMAWLRNRVKRLCIMKEEECGASGGTEVRGADFRSQPVWNFLMVAKAALRIRVTSI